MKAVLLVCLCLIAATSATSLKTRLAAKYSPYEATYAPADSSYRFQQEEPAQEQQQVEEPVPEPESPAMRPAIVEGAEQQQAEPTILPPEPTLTKPGGEEEQEEEAPEESEDPELVKLNTALEAVKEDILSTSKQIADERKWVAAVLKIVTSYEEKTKRVQEHILLLRQEMTKLYTKKKQIENLKLQRALEAKLREANEELSTLQTSLEHVETKHTELDKSHVDLRATISKINEQLAVLKGETPKKAEEEEKEEVKEAVEADQLEEANSREAAELTAEGEKQDTFLAF